MTQPEDFLRDENPDVVQASKDAIDITLDLRNLYAQQDFPQLLELVWALSREGAIQVILTQLMAHDIEIQNLKKDTPR